MSDSPKHGFHDGSEDLSQADFSQADFSQADFSQAGLSQAGLSQAEVQLQHDLSCLVDGELDEAAAARVMVQMEESQACQAFFEDARRYVRLHRDMADPERLEARLATLAGAWVPASSSSSLLAEAERQDLIHRLATIFYQLGKAYVLAGVDLEAFQERVFETAVAVETTKTRGRGFVDGVLLGGKDARTGVDWQQARHLFNGRLERIEEPLEKGSRLLLGALETDPSHEEARIYLAFLYSHQGKTIRAAELYREVFDTAMSMENRGHAANQLGRLYREECEWRKALTCWRWLTMTGLADADKRFWMARFNIGVVYANTGDQERSLYYFRRLLDAHPDHVADVAQAFAALPQLQRTIESQAGFPEALMERCPELFQGPITPEGPPDGTSEGQGR